MIATLVLENLQNIKKLVGEKPNVGICCGHPHVNLDDGTNESRELPLFCVQDHPEALSDPYDSDYFFRNFISMMKPGAPAVYS